MEFRSACGALGLRKPKHSLTFNLVARAFKGLIGFLAFQTQRQSERYKGFQTQDVACIQEFGQFSNHIA